jgi:hypothetical protein
MCHVARARWCRNEVTLHPILCALAISKPTPTRTSISDHACAPSLHPNMTPLRQLRAPPSRWLRGQPCWQSCSGRPRQLNASGPCRRRERMRRSWTRNSRFVGGGACLREYGRQHAPARYNVRCVRPVQRGAGTRHPRFARAAPDDGAQAWANSERCQSEEMESSCKAKLCRRPAAKKLIIHPV